MSAATSEATRLRPVTGEALLLGALLLRDDAVEQMDDALDRRIVRGIVAEMLRWASEPRAA